MKKYWNESKAELNVPQNTKNYNLNDELQITHQHKVMPMIPVLAIS